MASRSVQRRDRLVKICTVLPEVDVKKGEHYAFSVRKKKFAYWLNDHHGDGRVAVTFKAPPGENRALVDIDPERFFIPPYIGPKGWVGLYLDLRGVDWEEVEEMARESYRLAAPKTLARQLD
jgi:hypothetical protein